MNLKVDSKDIEFDGRTVTVTTTQYVVMRGGELLGKLEKTGILDGGDLAACFAHGTEILAGTQAHENGVVVAQSLGQQADINRVFSGPGGYTAFLKALRHAIEVNYGDFFVENARAVAEAAAKAEAMLKAKAAASAE
jgi:hypothetical protein